MSRQAAICFLARAATDQGVGQVSTAVAWLMRKVNTCRRFDAVAAVSFVGAEQKARLGTAGEVQPDGSVERETQIYH